MKKKVINPSKPTPDNMIFLRKILNERKDEVLKLGDIILCLPTDSSLPLSICEFGIVSQVIGNYVYCRWENRLVENGFHSTIGTPAKREVVLKTNLTAETITDKGDLKTLKQQSSIFNN